MRWASSWPCLTRPSISFEKCLVRRGWMRGVKPAHDGASLFFQKLARLVQRAEGQAGFREGLGGAFLAVDHGEDQSDLAADLAHRVRGLDRRAAGGGDVLDDDDAFACEAFALREALDRQARAVLLRLLAYEE